tara:strand:- start:100 stop:729 length:630 start_codon:yes stop_codon:yes gene_type:complete
MPNKKVKSVWEVLSKHPVTEKIEKKWYKDKSGKPYSLSYLSWAWAWGEVKKFYPEATYTIHEDIIYPNNTVEVRVSVTIEGQEHMMWLPVMDFKNNSKASPTSREISDARMRCLVKAIAMHGLGHYIYAGEDLPENEIEPPVKEQKQIMDLSTQDRVDTAIEFYENCSAESFEKGESNFTKLLNRKDITEEQYNQVVEARDKRKLELEI